MDMASFKIRILIHLLHLLQVTAVLQCGISLLQGARLSCSFPGALCHSSDQGYEIRIYSSKTMLSCWCQNGQPICSAKNGYESSTEGGNLTLTIYPCDDGTYVCESVPTSQQEASSCTLHLSSEDIQASMKEPFPSSSTTSTAVSITSPKQGVDVNNPSSTAVTPIVLGLFVAGLTVGLVISLWRGHTKDKQLKQKDQQLKQKDQQLEIQDQQLKQKDQQLEIKDKQIRNLQLELQSNQNTNNASHNRQPHTSVTITASALCPVSSTASRPTPPASHLVTSKASPAALQSISSANFRPVSPAASHLVSPAALQSISSANLYPVSPAASRPASLASLSAHPVLTASPAALHQAASAASPAAASSSNSPAISSTASPADVHQVSSTASPADVHQVSSTASPADVHQVSSTASPTDVHQVSSTASPADVHQVSSTASPADVHQVSPTVVPSTNFRQQSEYSLIQNTTNDLSVHEDPAVQNDPLEHQARGEQFDRHSAVEAGSSSMTEPRRPENGQTEQDADVTPVDDASGETDHLLPILNTKPREQVDDSQVV